MAALLVFSGWLERACITEADPRRALIADGSRTPLESGHSFSTRPGNAAPIDRAFCTTGTGYQPPPENSVHALSPIVSRAPTSCTSIHKHPRVFPDSAPLMALARVAVELGGARPSFTMKPRPPRKNALGIDGIESGGEKPRLAPCTGIRGIGWTPAKPRARRPASSNSHGGPGSHLQP